MAKQSCKRGKAKVSPFKLRSINHKVQSKGGRLASPVRVHNATPVCAPPLILTSPVRKKASITPVCDFIMSPVRPQHRPVRLLDSPVRLLDSPMQHSSDEEQYQDADADDVLPSQHPHPYSNFSPPDDGHFNVHASDTDGYDADLVCTPVPVSTVVPPKTGKIDYSKLTCFDATTSQGPAIDEQFAEILKKNWCLDKKTNPEIQVGLDNLFKQYKPPGNCLFDPPLVNKEVRKLLSAHQRCDLRFLSMQKIFNVTSTDIGRMAQITTNVCAMLGDVSHEISQNRRSYVRGALKDEYKELCGNKESYLWLFGDHLPHDIIDLGITNKLKKKDQYNYYSRGHQNFKRQGYSSQSSSRPQPYSTHKPQNSRQPFLGKGRGSLPSGNRRGHNQRK